jgi:hypothetical protein
MNDQDEESEAAQSDHEGEIKKVLEAQRPASSDEGNKPRTEAPAKLGWMDQSRQRLADRKARGSGETRGEKDEPAQTRQQEGHERCGSPAKAAISAVQQPADVDDAGARSDSVTDSDEGLTQRKGAKAMEEGNEERRIGCRSPRWADVMDEEGMQPEINNVEPQEAEGAVPQPAGDDDEGHPGAGASTPSSSAPHRRRGPTFFRSVAWEKVGYGWILAMGSAQETVALIDNVLKTRRRALYDAAREEGYQGQIGSIVANDVHFLAAADYLQTRTKCLATAPGNDGHSYIVYNFELHKRSKYLAFLDWADTDEGDRFLWKQDWTKWWSPMPRRSDAGPFVIPRDAKVGGHKKDVNVEVLDYLALFCVSSPSKV